MVYNYLRIGDAFELMNNHEAALKYFKTAQEIAKDILPENHYVFSELEEKLDNAKNVTV